MRVLHVHSGNLYGGVETLLRTLVEQRDLSPQMETEFALCFRGRLDDELRSLAALPYHLGNVRVSRPSSVRRARRSLGDVLKGDNYDVVVCHSSWSQAIFAPPVQAAGLPMVRWMHDASNKISWLKRWAQRSHPDAIICNSNFTAQSVSKLYPGVRAEVIYCPLARDAGNMSQAERAEIRKDLKTDERDVVIIQVSRMEEWKGQKVHLAALALLKDIPGWTCWFVGGPQRPQETEYLQNLKQQAGQFGLSHRVRFTGQRDDIPHLLAAADIFCQPNSDPEPFGLVFVEALAAKLSVVATSIGGALEIIDDSCGRLVPSNNPDKLAEVLKELVGSASQRAELGNAGPERARQLCDPATQMNLIHDYLRRSSSREVAA